MSTKKSENDVLPFPPSLMPEESITTEEARDAAIATIAKRRQEVQDSIDTITQARAAAHKEVTDLELCLLTQRASLQSARTELDRRTVAWYTAQSDVTRQAMEEQIALVDGIGSEINSLEGRIKEASAKIDTQTDEIAAKLAQGRQELARLKSDEEHVQVRWQNAYHDQGLQVAAGELRELKAMDVDIDETEKMLAAKKHDRRSRQIQAWETLRPWPEVRRMFHQQVPRPPSHEEMLIAGFLDWLDDLEKHGPQIRALDSSMPIAKLIDALTLSPQYIAKVMQQDAMRARTMVNERRYSIESLKSYYEKTR